MTDEWHKSDQKVQIFNTFILIICVLLRIYVIFLLCDVKCYLLFRTKSFYMQYLFLQSHLTISQRYKHKFIIHMRQIGPPRKINVSFKVIVQAKNRSQE